MVGSILRDDFGPESDVDFLVEFEPGPTPGLFGITEMEIELSEIIVRKADLRTAEDLNRYFREAVVNVYIEVAKDVPGANMATISGTFLSKVFEGPYQNMRKWIGEMKDFVQSKGKDIKKMYFFYTTCPKCAKKYGKNYVAILAQT